MTGVATMSDSAHGPVGSASTGSGGAVSCWRFFLPFLPFLPLLASPAVGPAMAGAVSSTVAPACVAVPARGVLAVRRPTEHAREHHDEQQRDASTTSRRVQ